MSLLAKSQHYLNRNRYHQMRRMLPEIAGGSGACGQDVLIAELLRDVDKGIFVDIGANDGVTISNTCYLERELGWTGVAVEPIPKIHAKLQENRTCQIFNGCVSPKSGTAKFLEVVDGVDMLSTLAENDTGLTARRLRKSAKRNNASIREIEVECLTFAQLMERYELDHVDFMSIDTEGGELAILQSIDYQRFPIRTISVENNYYTNDIRSFLESQGYLYVGTFKVDEIYLFGGESLQRAAGSK